MRAIVVLIILSGLYQPCLGQVVRSYFFEGEVTSQSGKGIRNAKLDVLSLNKTFVVDKNGKFSVNLPKADYLVRISASDYKSKQIYIGLKKDTLVKIMLESVFGGIALEEVKILGRTSDKVNAQVSGMEKLDRQVVDKMPALLGEKDPIKALQLLPGITGTTEGSAEMNVRGGGNDQNMVLLDNIPLYSSTHLFGLYSSFNPLAISSTTIYKGDFPAHFGGRLSSVTSIISADTLSKAFKAVADLGITTAKASLAIPMFKQKSSLYLSGRRSYYDVLFKTFGRGTADIFKFQDYNLSWIYMPDAKNRIKLSLYHESDAVGSVKNETGLSSGNSYKRQSALGLNWKHRFNNNFTNELTTYFNDYTSQLTEEKRNANLSYLYNFSSSVADVGISNNLSYTQPRLILYAGTDLVRHSFKPTQFYGDEFGEAFN
ncbi:MAG: TonB-dependent receptor [Bacteroidia bacterium]